MKRYLVGIFAMLLAFTFSAFTAPKAESLTQKNWIYDSIGDDTDKDDPQHYYLSGSGGTEPLECDGDDVRCGVIANDNGSGFPNLTPGNFTPVRTMEP